jgi:Domain of unknown function (DUF397)
MTMNGDWRKAVASQQNGNCVEVHRGLDGVRDSKNPSGPVLRVDLGVLLKAVKAGRLG